jgi:PQQ-like domain
MGAIVIGLGAQESSRLITRPKIPSLEVMDRLGLSFGWHARVALDGPLDSIYSIQVIPRGAGEALKTEVLVQTTVGAVHLFDGETGALRWWTPVGLRNSAMVPAAHNAQSIIVVRGGWFYVLNRATGAHRVYRRMQSEREYGVRLEAMPRAAPAANDELVAFSFVDRVDTFLLPDFDHIAAARERDPDILAQEKEGTAQPVPFWIYYDPTMWLNSSPVITPSQITVTARDGRVISLAYSGQASERLRFEFRTLGSLSSPIADRGDIGYFGGKDFNLYALNLENERMIWRFPTGAPLVRRPDVNDADVFVVSEGRGLFRVHRFTGENYWLEPSAERFLTAHYYKDGSGKFKLDRQGRILAKYVYATDRHGRLLILDGDRGGILSQFDTSAWQTPAENSWTDRLYLANRDGQILCLRPRDSRLPQVNKSIAGPPKAGDDRPAPPVAPAPPPQKKEEDKKIEEKQAAKAPWPREFTVIERNHVEATIEGDDSIMFMS